MSEDHHSQMDSQNSVHVSRQRSINNRQRPHGHTYTGDGRHTESRKTNTFTCKSYTQLWAGLNISLW